MKKVIDSNRLSKQAYVQPRMNVVEVKTGMQLLAGSITGVSVYDEDANEDEYGL